MSAPSPTPGNKIVVNPSVKYQVMTGWEGAISSSINDYKSFTTAQLGAILDVAVNDLGLTRARVSVDSGAENPTDWGGQYVSGLITETTYRAHSFEIVNDNADPNVINSAGFNFSVLDYQIDRVILPMRQRAAARGESVYLNLSYIDFGASPFEHYTNPAEYAEFMLAVFAHMQSKYRFVPNAIEVMLEPNDVTGWSGTRIGQVIVATAAKLKANGFPVPDFVASSTSSTAAASAYFDEIASVPGALALVKELSYHRYATDLKSLQAIATRAVEHGLRTSMLEYWSGNNNYLNLHQDLTVGRNSSWQAGVFADAFTSPHAWVHLVNGAAQPSPNAKLLRQYTKFVRPGAQRIDVSSTNASLEPVAFVNIDGRYVVVVKSNSDGSFSISGLPAGTYGVFYTTNSQYDVNLASITIGAGQSLSTNIPAAGVITIYRK
jgi:Glycosyl hydrolase family 30 beta sandwich domain